MTPEPKAKKAIWVVKAKPGGNNVKEAKEEKFWSKGGQQLGDQRGQVNKDFKAYLVLETQHQMLPRKQKFPRHDSLRTGEWRPIAVSRWWMEGGEWKQRRQILTYLWGNFCPVEETQGPAIVTDSPVRGEIFLHIFFHGIVKSLHRAFHIDFKNFLPVRAVN